MRYYATLCDSAYLPRALVLYESLLKHSSEDFRLHILGMDDDCLKTLWDLKLAKTIWTRLDDLPMASRMFSDNRTWQEFCWTCASQFTHMLLEDLQSEVTYLDADMMFFSNPKQVFDEIGSRSIGIIPHRFIPEKQYLGVNGQFNVSWVSFKNTPVGRECLSTWAAQVREKCSATDGCGDQKYLDEWPSKYGDEVCVIQNPGAGCAPWNLANYKLTLDVDSMTPYVDGHPVVFYHFHEFDYEAGRLTNYTLREEDRAFIYAQYLDEYEHAKETIASLSI